MMKGPVTFDDQGIRAPSILKIFQYRDTNVGEYSHTDKPLTI